MKKSLTRGAVVAFVSAAAVLPLAGGAQAAVTHDAPSAVSAWTHDHGFRCDRFGGWGGEGFEGGERRAVDEGQWGGEGREGGDWWGGRKFDRFCAPWAFRTDRRVNWINKRLALTSIRNSAFVILR